ncbi:uncharacterized protein METZ01_LOCUS301759, partial [marine metagenome]
MGSGANDIVTNDHRNGLKPFLIIKELGH